MENSQKTPMEDKDTTVDDLIPILNAHEIRLKRLEVLLLRHTHDGGVVKVNLESVEDFTPAI